MNFGGFLFIFKFEVFSFLLVILGVLFFFFWCEGGGGGVWAFEIFSFFFLKFLNFKIC